jgi:hypothetical protein
VNKNSNFNCEYGCKTGQTCPHESNQDSVDNRPATQDPFASEKSQPRFDLAAWLEAELAKLEVRFQEFATKNSMLRSFDR